MFSLILFEECYCKQDSGKEAKCQTTEWPRELRAFVSFRV